MVNPKYTFLLPAFKGRFLDEMLRSIQRQTYSDFKVIVSDDCSPEDIHTIVLPYLNDSRFSFRRNDKNIGGEKLVDHWNLLLEMCDTEYCIMASDDDVYDEHFLEEIDNLSVKYPELDVFRSRVELIDASGCLLIDECIYKEYVNQIAFIYQCYSNGGITCVPNYVFRTNILRRNGGFVKFPLAWSSDTATAIMMAKNGCANTSDCLLKFRHSGENISNTKNAKVHAEMKVVGMLQYDLWFKNFTSSIQISDQHERFLLNRIMGCHKQTTEMIISYDLAECKVASFIRCIKQMRKQKLESANTVVYYIKKTLFRMVHI